LKYSVITTNGAKKYIQEGRLLPKLEKMRRKDRYIMFLNHLLKKSKNIIKNSLANNNICIMGIDGTGKTSITCQLKKLLGAEIQYMGYKNNITLSARNRFETGRHISVKGPLSKTINFVIWLIEMWYRVIRHWPDEKIVIYDRYAWDRYIFHQGFARVVSIIFFKLLYPRPKYVFYLYCPIDISIARKGDIKNIEEFIRLKAKYDKEFLKSKSVIAVNTQESTLDSALSAIIKSLPDKLFKNT
jgi:thymidylate kinase